MPPDRRLVRAIIAALCVACLAGCGVGVTNQTPYWMPRDSNGNYTLTLKVEPQNGAQLDAVRVSVNGAGLQSMVQDPDDRTKWTFTYHQDPNLYPALKVRYQVDYTGSGAGLAPAHNVISLPSATDTWVVPILGAGADSDADGSADQFDSCVYQPNNQIEHGPTFGNLGGPGVPCDVFGSPGGTRNGSIAVYQNGVSDVAVMQDNMGNFMLARGEKNYFAFQTLVRLTAQISSVDGVNGVSAAAVAQMQARNYPWQVEILDCALAYQDDGRGIGVSPQGAFRKSFIEVYAANDAHPCSFTIKQSGQLMLTGSEVLITVRTITEPADPDFGKAIMFARVTVAGPPSGAPPDAQKLYDALTYHNPVRYAYFTSTNFGATTDEYTLADNCAPADLPRGPCARGRFASVGYFVFPRPPP